jgi:GDSL-like Lipase/Acylhydrolase
MYAHHKLCLILVIATGSALAQTPPLIGMGDSLGEGVQSLNAFAESQPNTYLNRVATQMGVPFALPLLTTSPKANVYSDSGRSRISLTTDPADLAFSGATTEDVLTSVANTGTPATEQDLILPPYYGMSQMQIVEQVKPKMVIAWVGNDDLISEILAYNDMGSQSGVTPLATFASEYKELVSRLKATGATVVMSNIPDLTKVAWLFDNDDLTRYTGTNYNLPAGYVTAFETMVMLKLGVLPGSVLSDPSYVLSPAQLTAIEQQVQVYNKVIADTANAAGFPVVDAYSVFESIIANPITIEGITINTHYNGGAFSLDGIHPSDTGYAIFANAFINAANKGYGLSIPLVSKTQFVQIFNADPYIDFGGNGVVAGRPYTGLLESLGPSLGLSGGQGGPTNTVTAAEFMRQYSLLKGQIPNPAFTSQDVIAAVEDMFGHAH